MESGDEDRFTPLSDPEPLSSSDDEGDVESGSSESEVQNI